MPWVTIQRLHPALDPDEVEDAIKRVLYDNSELALNEGEDPVQVSILEERPRQDNWKQSRKPLIHVEFAEDEATRPPSVLQAATKDVCTAVGWCYVEAQRPFDVARGRIITFIPQPDPNAQYVKTVLAELVT